jgi:hypothetical protein|tara:strand:- start:84 stop:1061 length:978 start_codon:yes stop_codon:yes gene_type:complete
MATLAELRAKLAAQDQRQTGTRETDNAIYAFWNIPHDTTATMRFLPDGDESNTFFWQERQMIRMPFPGVKGQDEAKPVTVNVPCIEMWGETCPVHAEIRPWFKDPALEDIGRKYWKKRSYIFQGFVVNNPLEGDANPENPIRRFVINPSIYKIIKAALMDPEMENLPTDYTAGTDFRLTKTQKGQYADYSTSNWARRERSLSEDELAAVSTHGLFTLNDYLPKRPSADDVKVIYDMFQASVDGELYDPAKWSDHYRPYGVSASSNTGTVQVAQTETVAVTASDTTESKTEAVVETVSEETSSNSKSADEILAMIRDRKKNVTESA